MYWDSKNNVKPDEESLLYDQMEWVKIILLGDR